MKDTIIFIDAGFLSKIKGELINKKYFDKFNFSRNVAKNENLFLKHLFYYDAPPHKSNYKMLKTYNNFKKDLLKNKQITLREGRLQKLNLKIKCVNCDKVKTETKYTQKGVDTLLNYGFNEFSRKI